MVTDERIETRANLLTSMTMGLFLSARIDPADAAIVSDGIAEEVGSWRKG